MPFLDSKRPCRGSSLYGQGIRGKESHAPSERSHAPGQRIGGRRLINANQSQEAQAQAKPGSQAKPPSSLAGTKSFQRDSSLRAFLPRRNLGGALPASSRGFHAHGVGFVRDH